MPRTTYYIVRVMLMLLYSLRVHATNTYYLVEYNNIWSTTSITAAQQETKDRIHTY